MRREGEPTVRRDRKGRCIVPLQIRGRDERPASEGQHYKSGPDYGVRAMTRRGLPEPPTILSGAAMTTAPVGGNLSRLQRLARPNFPLPCMTKWFEKGGSNLAAWP